MHRQRSQLLLDTKVLDFPKSVISEVGSTLFSARIIELFVGAWTNIRSVLVPLYHTALNHALRSTFPQSITRRFMLDFFSSDLHGFWGIGQVCSKKFLYPSRAAMTGGMRLTSHFIHLLNIQNMHNMSRQAKYAKYA